VSPPYHQAGSNTFHDENNAQARDMQNYSHKIEGFHKSIANRKFHISPDAVARAGIIFLSIFLTWATWAHWGDLQVDCGRELYVPSEILRGRLLYRDIFYAFGPLAPLSVALLIRIFGQHLYVLYLFGLTILVGSALLLFEIARILEEGYAVGFAAGVALVMQGFGPTIFNYMCPWTYAGPMGLVLSTLCCYFAIRYVLSSRLRELLVSGIFAGLALLCKQEFGIVSYVLVGFTLLQEGWNGEWKQTLASAVWACTPGLLLLVCVYGWFFYTLTPRFMITENWVELPGSYFMRTYGAHWASINGLRLVPGEIVFLILNAGSALAIWLLIAKLRKDFGFGCFMLLIGLLAALLILTRKTSFFQMYTLFFFMTIFPVGMFFIGLGFFLCALSRSLRSYSNDKARSETVLAVFALTLAIRVLARVVPSGYSIFYDGPLFLIFMIALSRCIGFVLNETSSKLQPLVTSVLAAEILFLVIALFPGASQRSELLETSWGGIYLQPREATVAKQILDFVEKEKRHGLRVALLPELPMVYALTGTEAPSRWYTFFPGCPSPGDEESYIRDLDRVKPNYIILTNRYTGEYGPAYFGIDYDRRILGWIETNYSKVGEFGDFRRDGERLMAALLYEKSSFAGEQRTKSGYADSSPGGNQGDSNH
jgi:hypothetical protein